MIGDVAGVRPITGDHHVIAAARAELIERDQWRTISRFVCCEQANDNQSLAVKTFVLDGGACRSENQCWLHIAVRNPLIRLVVRRSCCIDAHG